MTRAASSSTAVDYAGCRSEEREYPANWKIGEIRDGARHAGATALALHALVHDAVAAAAVMKLHEAGTGDAQCSAWARLRAQRAVLGLLEAHVRTIERWASMRLRFAERISPRMRGGFCCVCVRLARLVWMPCRLSLGLAGVVLSRYGTPQGCCMLLPMGMNLCYGSSVRCRGTACLVSFYAQLWRRGFCCAAAAHAQHPRARDVTQPRAHGRCTCRTLAHRKPRNSYLQFIFAVGT
jgi:hypothetical protein